MGVKSGYFGWVNDVGCIRRWSVNEINSPVRFAATCTDGVLASIHGVSDWSGSYGAFGANAVKYPGETFDFIGLSEETPSLAGGTFDGFRGTAIVSAVNFGFQFGNNQLFGHTVNFQGQGKPVSPIGSIPDGDVDQSGVGLDVSVPNSGDADTKIQVADDLAGTNAFDVADVTSASLSITRQLSPYVSSSTEGYRKRTYGHLGATGSIDLLFEKFFDSTSGENKVPIFVTRTPATPKSYRLRIYINSTQYWLLYPVFFTSRNATIDRESGRPNGMSMSFEWGGIYDPSGGPATLGSLTAPNGTNVISLA